MELVEILNIRDISVIVEGMEYTDTTTNMNKKMLKIKQKSTKFD